MVYLGEADVAENMPKEVKPTVILREAVNFPGTTKFPPGVYTRHPPTKCDQTLDGRPIHLQKKRAYDGKEMGRRNGADGAQAEFLVPSKEPSVYPKIISRKEYDYFREKGRNVTKEEREAMIDAAEKEKDRLLRESMARKEEMRRMDMRKGPKGQRVNEVEAEARKRTMHLLERAFNLKLEQEEEIQKCNRLILETKCRAIRDAQISEKKLIEKELAEEDERLNRMAENERRLGLRDEEKKEEEERRRRMRTAQALKEQIEEVEMQRVIEFERKQEESRLINLSNIAWQQEEMRQQQIKEAEHARMRKELAEGNDQLRHFKDMEREENRIIDLRIQESMRKQEERAAQIAEETRLANLRKEREKQRVSEQVQLAQNVQATIDEMNAARIQEEVEREWRRKEKEEALKRIEDQRRMKESRDDQINNKRIMQAMEIERDKREFQRVLVVQKEALCREAKERERKHHEAMRHRSEILKQVNEKERERIAARQKMFEEGLAIRTQNEIRMQKLRGAMQRKCQEMRDNKVPEYYVNEVKRMIDTIK
ncbi:cilia- and flagella-associated protein 45 isoform X1 [Neodiprion lecontei]|uniref:Cilia- and flagella-associated protein 45 n=3 Tax=Neodiprion lecontei TaxID=441921 RepID=A0ABM3G7Z6_NEOLC|nr:cilia- and flagella-associated protein 45 isoform X1 [Neodiprion lecontei]